MSTCNTIKLTFIGDLMCQMAQIRAIKRSARSFNDVFRNVKYIWDKSDFVCGNLETPVTGGSWRLAFEEMRFNAPVSFLRAIKDAGISFVTTANNHILDRGPDGLDATLYQLEQIGIETTGAYRTQEASEGIFVKEIKGIRFALISCTYDTNSGRKSDMLRESQYWKIDYLHKPSDFLGTPFFAIKRTIKGVLPSKLKYWIRKKLNGGVPCWSPAQDDCFPVTDYDIPLHKTFLQRVVRKVKLAKKCADIVIVLPHIGGQYNLVPGPWQLKITDDLVDAGADLVISNHAHTPLRAEFRRGVFCAHSLGNFCFTPRVGFYNDQCQADYSIILNCFFDVASRKLVGKEFLITKSIVEQDGVAVVTRPTEKDAQDVDVICRRVMGLRQESDLKKEYLL